ncbi:MAG: 6-carboxytetrahydropterin synthase QueD [Isosphaeraceae bacterium]
MFLSRLSDRNPILPLSTAEPAMSLYRVTRDIEFCYGHRLLNYEGKCRHLHGHNGRAVIVLEAPRLDARGMLVDFSDIKQKVQRWIDENLDHNLLLSREDPILPVLQERGERVFVMDVNPTAENIARLIFEKTVEAGFPVVEVILWETAKCSAGYSTRRESAGS